MRAIPNEKLLLRKIREEDDGSSFQLLFDTYWEVLFLQALKKTKSQDLAQDLAQETFISFWKYRKRLTEIRNLKSYLLTMLKYQFLKWIDIEKIVFDEIDEIQLNASFTDPEDGFKIMEFNELYAFLMETIDELPTKNREIFLQNRFENRSIKELAQTYNISESTVRNHLSQANAKIQTKLEKNIYSIAFLSILIQ